MSKMEGTGPDRAGSKTGRCLGRCLILTDNETVGKIGAGQGLRRKAGGNTGHGRRLKSGTPPLFKK